ncbi:MlaD family protein [Actinocorallia longicatena]|uniref:Phospholipid/cholesterol/gamma-HCH transport system substrate-binding protein n=1 Tax=Actinocorallia longicatena TaxID=111803 RepID=A0ABP6PYG7_9ACTN
MNTELSLGTRFAIAVATIVLTSATLYVLITKPYESKGMTLTAEFGQAGQGLGKSSPVKIRGMQVGRVNEIDLLPNGRALITMSISDGHKIADTVVASLEPASVFGPKFINLIPGEHEATGPYVKAGTRLEKTTDPRDLNDLLNDANATLAQLDPKDLAVIVHTLSEGLDGEGGDIRELIDNVNKIVDVAHVNRKNAEVFLRDLARLARIQGAGDDIGSIVSGANAVIDTAASGNGRLRGFADGVNGVSGIVAGGFDHHGDGLKQGFRSGERAVAVIAAQLGLVGTSIPTIIDLLPTYKAVGWPSGGDPGHRLLAVKVLIPSNPCHILLGLPACQQWYATTPAADKNAKKKGN